MVRFVAGIVSGVVMEKLLVRGYKELSKTKLFKECRKKVKGMWKAMPLVGDAN